MAILVTGAGNVGCEIAVRLLARGEQVVLMDMRVDRERLAGFGLDKVPLAMGDVGNYAELEEITKKHKIDRIVHTAAILIPAAQADPLRGINVNLIGAINIMELARKHDLKKVVLAGSSSVIFGILPGFDGPSIPDDFSMRVLSQLPSHFYAVSKLALEFYAKLYRESFNVDVTVLRYSSVVRSWLGPGQGIVGNMFAAYVEPLLRGETAMIDNPLWIWEGVEEFVDARDCAEATVAALFTAQPKLIAYNIIGAGAYTTPEFADIVRSAFPKAKVEVTAKTKVGIGGAPIRRVRMDGSAATRDFGYVAKYDLKSSLQHYSRPASAKMPVRA